MSSTKTKSILRSFIVIPMIATSLSLSSFTASINQFVATKTDDSQTTISAEDRALQMERESNAAKIDAYFAKGKMPLAGKGMKMVLEAEKHGLDWRLIPAIAVRESTGGIYACKTATFNPFGWGSCTIGFKSYDHAIEVLATNLGGDNPKTASYYANKSIEGILKTYNPPSVVANYSGQVIAIMNQIEDTQI